MRRGLVRARRGPGGGYQLARPPETVSFRDVIEAVEGPITLNVCVDGSSACNLQPACRMFRVWEEGQRVLLDVFSHTMLNEIASSRPHNAFRAGLVNSEVRLKINLQQSILVAGDPLAIRLLPHRRYE